MTTRQEWALALLAFGDWPPSAEKVLGIVSWAVAEGSDARWNPLDTTEPAPGDSLYNSAGVRNYPSLQVGLEAVYATLHNGHYAGILACLADPSGSSAMALATAVGASPWGTGNFSRVVEIVRSDPAPYYGHPVAGSGAAPPWSPPGPAPAPGPLPQPQEEPMLVLEAPSGTWLLIGSGKVYVPTAELGGALVAKGIPLLTPAEGVTDAWVASIPSAA